MRKDLTVAVRDFFGDVLVNTVLECAYELLLTAATTGRPKDRRRATEQVELLLWQRRGL